MAYPEVRDFSSSEKSAATSPGGRDSTRAGWRRYARVKNDEAVFDRARGSFFFFPSRSRALTTSIITSITTSVITSITRINLDEAFVFQRSLLLSPEPWRTRVFISVKPYTVYCEYAMEYGRASTRAKTGSNANSRVPCLAASGIASSPATRPGTCVPAAHPGGPCTAQPLYPARIGRARTTWKLVVSRK